MSSSNERTAGFWDVMHAADGGDRENYLNHPLVAAYTSLRASGTIVPHLDVVIAEIRARTPPGARILSPGCGSGRKEAALARALPDRFVVAGDIAEAALQQGREHAAREGLRNIEFVVQDFNDIHLEPRSLAAIVGMGALHHIENLEQFWAETRRALQPGGVVMGQEYIGPNRFQWTDAQVEEGDRVLRDIVPAEHKVVHARVVRTPVEEIVSYDPSEAVRSIELLPTLREAGFELAGYASAGGALLQPVLNKQIHTFDPRNWQHNLVLSRLFAEEDALMAAGRLGDDFCMFVTQPLP
ncbi:MAG: class I SAM-dependent methyltransferase [Planctomycetota bacterium]